MSTSQCNQAGLLAVLIALGVPMGIPKAANEWGLPINLIFLLVKIFLMYGIFT